jgi:hypothetical protein
MSFLEMVDDVLDESIEMPPGTNGLHLEPRCRVCRNDLVRKKVNDLLAAGASYKMILRALGQDNDTLDKCDRVTIDSIRNHTARHFPVQNVAKATYRDILERRAKENGVDFVEGVATALTPMALYECVMNEAFRRLVDGDVDVSIDTGLRAAEKLQALIDARAGEADWARAQVQMGRIIDVMHTFIPKDRWPEVQAALRGDRPIHAEQSEPLEDIHMIHIDDMPDQDGN